MEIKHCSTQIIMRACNIRPPAAPEVIPADPLYTLAEVQERLKLGQHAMRQAEGPLNPEAAICALMKLPSGCIQAMDAGQEEGQSLYVIYRNAKQMKCLCCGRVRFRLRSAGRRLPLFVCNGWGKGSSALTKVCIVCTIAT